MASSSYYYSLYEKKKRQISEYESNLKHLRPTLGALNNVQIQISNVNNKLDSLIDDLNKGVRHNSTFTFRANDLANEKEKSVGIDSRLSKAQDGLQDEISRVERLLSQAIEDRDYYYRRYKEEREREREERLRKLQGGV